MEHNINKILLVEDSRTFGNLMQNRLKKKLKLEVVWTTSLKETVAILSSTLSPFSIALLDYTLPDAPNGEVVDLVADHGITSIVFTGNVNTKIREQIWSKKVADYILKNDPNSVDYVISTIQRLTRNTHDKVLVVDDSALFRKHFSDLLYIHQFNVLTAVDGENALTLLQRHPDIKLIITDYNMPKMDGYTLCQKVREQYKKEELSIIGVSASNDYQMAANFIKNGASDFLMKDAFFVEEFYCRVNQCMDNVTLFHEIREAAVKDFLTGLYNRRFFFESGTRRFSEALSKGGSVVCAMLDIDFFKKVNDTYGHDVGDIVIQQVAATIKTLTPESAIVARFGGEEFCVLAFDMDENQARECFWTLCRTIEAKAIGYNDGKDFASVTISTGVSTLPAKSLAKLIEEADQRLYLAKNGGRNQVVMWNDTIPPPQ